MPSGRRAIEIQAKWNQSNLRFHLEGMTITTKLPLSGFYASENSSLPAPHSGQIQSSGKFSNAVPGSTPLSGSPIAGSYT